MNIRILVTLAAVVIAATGCAHNNDHVRMSQTATSTTPMTTTTTTVPPATTVTPITRVQTPVPQHGLVVGGGDKLNIIDANTGRVFDFATFANPKDPNVEVGDMGRNDAHVYSPDFQRWIAHKNMPTGDTHAGWIDRDGNFTDASAWILGPESVPDTNVNNGFQKRTKHVHYPKGFDSAGRLLVEDSTEREKPTNNSVHILVVENDPHAPVAEEFDALTGSWIYGYDGKAVPVPQPSPGSDEQACQYVINDYTWIDPTHYVTVMRNVKNDTTESAIGVATCVNGFQQPWQPEDTPNLLPADNDKPVNELRVSPDHKTIMFYSSVNGWSGYFTIPVTGGVPQKTGVDETTNPSPPHVVAWI